MAMSRRLSARLYFFGTRMYFWKLYGLAGRTFRLVAERGHRDWSPGALKWLGDSLAGTGHIGRAQEAYRRCAGMRVHQDSARAAIALARLREKVQGDADGAIDAYRTALRLGEILALDPLVSLLDARGDKGEADALRAKKNIESQLYAALGDAGHHHAHSRAKDFLGYAIAVLGPEETVEDAAWALVDHEGWNRPSLGYLVLTDQRLMLLDDFLYPNGYYGRDLPDYVLLSIGRAGIDDVRLSRDADDTWITVEAELPFRARIQGDHNRWVDALTPRRKSH
jgi:hypothetical protein